MTCLSLHSCKEAETEADGRWAACGAPEPVLITALYCPSAVAGSGPPGMVSVLGNPVGEQGQAVSFRAAPVKMGGTLGEGPWEATKGELETESCFILGAGRV